MDGRGCGIALTARAAGEGELFRLENGGRPAAVCERRGGTVRLCVYYDFKSEPLALTGRAEDGEELCLRVLPHRIELWIGGRLCDEEWPCGRHFLSGALCRGSVPCRAEPFSAPALRQPAVLGEFEGAQGWRPEENVFVGDCMPYADGGRYHVLYLKDRRHHGSKWGLGAHQWEHISTADFAHWQIHPTAVAIEEADEGSICTGSWIRAGDRQSLYYTIRSCDGSPARICRSVSEDGWHFRRDRDFCAFLGERYTAASARDPKVVSDGAGRYHMFVTTTLAREGRGCLAHLTSPDGAQWREEDEPICVAPGSDEPECCDWIALGGTYYLLFSLGGRGRYMYSDEPFRGFREPDDPFVPFGAVPKGAVWNGEIVFAGFEGRGDYGGTMTFGKARRRADGQLMMLPM